eukprot:scaffold33188_cov63-Phaeocystis_antarctica.AAC.2
MEGRCDWRRAGGVHSGPAIVSRSLISRAVAATVSSGTTLALMARERFAWANGERSGGALRGPSPICRKQNKPSTKQSTPTATASGLT